MRIMFVFPLSGKWTKHMLVALIGCHMRFDGTAIQFNAKNFGAEAEGGFKIQHKIVRARLSYFERKFANRLPVVQIILAIRQAKHCGPRRLDQSAGGCGANVSVWLKVSF